MKLPENLYHAAPVCVHDSIEEEGLKSNFTEVYAAGSVGEALSFMYLRILDHPHPTWDENGKLGFEFVPHDAIDIWIIDTGLTDEEAWNTGTDHSSSFFGGARSYVHTGDIPSDAIIGCATVTRQELDALLKEKQSQRNG